MQNVTGKMLTSMALARSSLYALEWIPINIFGRVLSGSGDKPTKAEIEALWPHLRKLHEREAENITKGVYPLSALEVETPWGHARSFASVLTDGVRVAWRMKTRNHSDFDAKRARNHDLPEYPRRVRGSDHREARPL